MNYLDELVGNFWVYRRLQFSNRDLIFETASVSRTRPPVFHQRFAGENLLYAPSTSKDERRHLELLLPVSKRHKWFRSMKSSQALTQSVFGNLYLSEKLNCLDALKGDAGRSLFAPIEKQNGKRHCKLEYEIQHLGEDPKRCTSVDVLIGTDYKIGIECKLTEDKVGACSRPELKPNDDRYERQFCNGRYELQRGRTEFCPLSEIGIKYWRFVPNLFKWSADAALNPCPLNSNYQLVRSVLAICVQPDGSVRTDCGHVVLLYDERNPAFGQNGKGLKAWKDVKAALKVPELLQKCTWQQVAASLRRCPEMMWLAKGLMCKYGLV
jgi:hypothetical protein